MDLHALKPFASRFGDAARIDAAARAYDALTRDYLRYADSDGADCSGSATAMRLCAMDPTLIDHAAHIVIVGDRIPPA